MGRSGRGPKQIKRRWEQRHAAQGGFTLAREGERGSYMHPTTTRLCGVARAPAGIVMNGAAAADLAVQGNCSACRGGTARRHTQHGRQLRCRPQARLQAATAQTHSSSRPSHTHRRGGGAPLKEQQPPRARTIHPSLAAVKAATWGLRTRARAHTRTLGLVYILRYTMWTGVQPGKGGESPTHHASVRPPAARRPPTRGGWGAAQGGIWEHKGGPPLL